MQQSLSELLNLLGADEKAVQEIEIEEKIIISSHSDVRMFALKAERSIFEWLLQRDNLGVRKNHVGFPDYEVSYDDGIKEGVEVISINEDRHPMKIANRLKDIMFRTYYEIKQKRFDKIKFVFLSKHQDYDFARLNSKLERLISGFEGQAFEIIFGYLNDQDEFIQVR